MKPPEPIFPPTSTLNPMRPAFFAGTRAMSCDSACVQLSRQPVTVMLNFRGRLVNSGLPCSPTIMRSKSCTTGEASSNSCGFKPASGQPLMFRTLSTPVCNERKSTPRSFSQISGTLSSVNPRSSICCRVVMSATPLPSRRESSAMARSCCARAKPFGIRMRIMNLPGVGRR